MKVDIWTDHQKSQILYDHQKIIVKQEWLGAVSLMI